MLSLVKKKDVAKLMIIFFPKDWAIILIIFCRVFKCFETLIKINMVRKGRCKLNLSKRSEAEGRAERSEYTFGGEKFLT